MNTTQKAFSLIFKNKDLLHRTLDGKGVPDSINWHSLFNCISSQLDYEELTNQQKKELLSLASDILKSKNFSKESHKLALSRQYNILKTPYMAELQEAITESEKLLHEFRQLSMKRSGDVEILESTAISTIESGDKPHQMIHKLRSAFRNVIDMMKEDTANLDRLSKTDPLTGLSNRRAFDLYLEKKIKAQTPLSLLMLDIDHFKKFNDSFGHRIGDQAINTVAKIIRDSMALNVAQYGNDYLTVRYGGEEFAVLVHGAGIDKAVKIAEAIKEKIENYSFVIRDIKGQILHRDITITVSIGVAEMNPSWDKSQRDFLIDAADKALYQAKSAGRNLIRH